MKIIKVKNSVGNQKNRPVPSVHWCVVDIEAVANRRQEIALLGRVGLGEQSWVSQTCTHHTYYIELYVGRSVLGRRLHHQTLSHTTQPIYVTYGARCMQECNENVITHCNDQITVPFCCQTEVGSGSGTPVACVKTVVASVIICQSFWVTLLVPQSRLFGSDRFVLFWKKKGVEEVDTCPIRVKSCALRRRVENE